MKALSFLQIASELFDPTPTPAECFSQYNSQSYFSGFFRSYNFRILLNADTGVNGKILK